ncbi:MAG: hypothetical protein KQH67_02420 [Bacteroidetes bacterium]|nr:hypothetical protein [Bacteroidota bacterium]
MKKFIFLFTVLLSIYSITGLHATPDKENASEPQIHILCSPDLYPVVLQWTAEFSRQHPGSENFVVINETEINDKAAEETDLHFITNYAFEPTNSSASWKIIIGRDVFVPVINSNNPLSDQMNESGIKLSDLAVMLNNQNEPIWSSLTNGENIRLNFYLTKNESDNSSINKFLDTPLHNAHASIVNSNEELVAAIQQDINGFGFCKLNDIVNPNSQSWLENISVLPIDKNGNGKLDYFENIYLNPDDFTRAVWIGKYPKAMVNNFYVLADESPKNETEVAFLNWITDDGQNLLAANGFTGLVSSEILANIQRLNNEDFYTDAATSENYALLKIVMALIIITGLVSLGFSWNRQRKNKESQITSLTNASGHLPNTITETRVNLPNGLYFDKTHTWVFMEKDGIVKVGIDDFLQRITGPYTRVKMKKPGESLKKNEALITLIQDGKQLNVYAPISGKIMDINEQLFDEPSMINASPYADGWIYMIKPSNYPREIQFLRMSEKYREWLKNEIARLKDFLAVSANVKSLQMAQVSYQDGGEIINHVLHEFGPEVWEDFQKKFIETSVIN